MTLPASSTALNTLKDWLLPVVIIFIGGITTWLTRLDDRMYDFQGTVVTESKLEKFEERMTSQLDRRMSSQDEKLNRQDRKLDRLIDQMDSLAKSMYKSDRSKE